MKVIPIQKQEEIKRLEWLIECNPVDKQLTGKRYYKRKVL